MMLLLKPKSDTVYLTAIVNSTFFNLAEMSAAVAHPAAQIRPSVASQEIANHSHNEDGDDNPFASVGISLVLGFCFMLLVDQCSRSRSNSRDIEAVKPISTRSFTATVGLVVHAAGKKKISFGFRARFCRLLTFRDTNWELLDF